ncbi:MAG: hypothetical protein WDM87_13680 [Terracidiphilus sp.]
MAKASATANAVAQAEAQVAQNSASIRTSASEIAPLEASIKGFFGEIDEHRRKMAASVDEASKFLTESSALVTRLLSESNAKVGAEIERLTVSAKALGESQASTLSAGLEAHRTGYAEMVAGFKQGEMDRLKAASDAATVQLTTEQEEHAALMSDTSKRLGDLEAGPQAEVRGNYREEL